MTTMHVVCVHADGRADLREMPSEKQCASGSIEAVRAAANLIAGKNNWRIEDVKAEKGRDPRRVTV